MIFGKESLNPNLLDLNLLYCLNFLFMGDIEQIASHIVHRFTMLSIDKLAELANPGLNTFECKIIEKIITIFQHTSEKTFRLLEKSNPNSNFTIPRLNFDGIYKYCQTFKIEITEKETLRYIRSIDKLVEVVNASLKIKKHIHPILIVSHYLIAYYKYPFMPRNNETKITEMIETMIILAAELPELSTNKILNSLIQAIKLNVASTKHNPYKHLPFFGWRKHHIDKLEINDRNGMLISVNICDQYFDLMENLTVVTNVAIHTIRCGVSLQFKQYLKKKLFCKISINTLISQCDKMGVDLSEIWDDYKCDYN